MKVTVEDISNFPEFADLKLIAGRGGLNKAVEKCGILDYEFVEGVREKWYNTNFRDENMIVMTSFLYAKDNEYLIMDAVKNLASRKCSGLIIKNIFHLPIHENVIRYADTMNFPILVIEGSNIHFEDLIVLISERIRHYELLHYRESKVDEILRSGSDYRLLESISYDINPTFKTDMVAMFFKAKGQFGPREYLKMEKLIEDSALMTASDSMFYYRDGFFIIHSREMFTCVDAEKLAKPFIEMFGEAAGGFRVGISAVHHLLWQIKNCFEESKYAASLDSGEASGYVLYENLGIYKVILPYCTDSVMKEFCRDYIKPLEDYDLETKGNLLETAINYVLNDADIQKTAQAMLQHKNTIRYRLKNISNIIGMNVFETKNYEILSFAVRIFICNDENI
ncbi:MAG: PucR family transcriptional regulator [Firmicutes bacterium]|nr:PucR family transcriptional regulator [Bacillota bacterium]